MDSDDLMVIKSGLLRYLVMVAVTTLTLDAATAHAEAAGVRLQ